MKREKIVSDLIKEGFSEKTLVRFTDKQLNELHSRIISEQISATTKAGIEMPHVKSGSPDEKTLKTQGRTFVAYENEMKEDKELTNKQIKNIASKAEPKDKITKDDFEVLRKQKKQTNETKGEKWIQKAIHPSKEGSLKKALGVKKDETIPVSKLKSAAKKGGKLGQRARLAMTLKKLKESKEIENWVGDLTEKQYHPFTSKGDIMNLINEKLNKTNVKNDDKSLPDFLTYDSIKSHEISEDKPTIAPSKPKVEPGKKPKTPYQPGPGKNPKPKALKENNVKSKSN
jgi:hypothetical protein